MNETEKKTYVSQSNITKGILIGFLLSIPIWLMIIITIFIF